MPEARKIKKKTRKKKAPAKAVGRKSRLPELTDRQRAFCTRIVNGCAQGEAARLSGYGGFPDTAAARLMRQDIVRGEIARQRKAIQDKSAVTVEYIVHNLRSIAAVCQERDGRGRIDSAGANKALELMGKSIGMFTDRVEHGGLEGLTEAMARIGRCTNG